MAPHDLIALEAGSIGIRAEMNAPEATPDHASRVLKHCLQQKNELLAKEKLQQKRILEDVYRKHFLDVPLAVPSCQVPKEIPCKADPKRASVNKVFTRAIEAGDFEKHATQREGSFHSPGLTVWSELCHVSFARPATPARKNMFFA